MKTVYEPISYDPKIAASIAPFILGAAPWAGILPFLYIRHRISKIGFILVSIILAIGGLGILSIFIVLGCIRSRTVTQYKKAHVILDGYKGVASPKTFPVPSFFFIQC